MLDGEIVCLDADGKPQFYDLLRRRVLPFFYAFDIIHLDGRDLRGLPLIERKAILKRLVPAGSRLLYAGHVEGRGVDLFRAACAQDIEGIVAKWKYGTYIAGEERKTSWLKVKNPTYRQMEGRAELFEKRR